MEISELNTMHIRILDTKAKITIAINHPWIEVRETVYRLQEGKLSLAAFTNDSRGAYQALTASAEYPTRLAQEI